MDLGSFSISLSVRDLAASRSFYERLGFQVIDGKEEENWLILRNGEAKIGLFQGKFEGNLLTFGPPDVRAVQRKLRENGIDLLVEADETTTGPAHAVLRDPDGNVLLLDQL
jgi:lactoylglutathione lyase